MELEPNGYTDADGTAGALGANPGYALGRLAKAFRTMDSDELVHEFGDVLAWLTSLANLTGVDLEDAAARYADGCPRCGESPCACEFDR